MTAPYLSADMARCAGDPHESLCWNCRRKRQLDSDDPKRWYPQMVPPISGRRCAYRLPMPEPKEMP